MPFPLKREHEQAQAGLHYNRPLDELNLADLKTVMLMMGWSEDTSADGVSEVRAKLVKNSRKYGNALFVYDINL